jgi:hypothetical protein
MCISRRISTCWNFIHLRHLNCSSGSSQLFDGLRYENGIKHGESAFFGPQSLSELTYVNNEKQGKCKGWGPGRAERPGEMLYQTSTYVDSVKQGAGRNLYQNGDMDEYSKRHIDWDDPELKLRGHYSCT